MTQGNVPAWLEVNLDTVRTNASALAARAGAPIVAMLKADAYGMGAVPVAQVLQHEPHVWALGVATVAEGAALRDARIDARLLCCTPLLSAEFATAIQAGITPSLSAAEDIATWCELTDRPWHLSIDTGMNRAGVPWQAAGELRDVIAVHPPEGAFTHFAAADVQDASRVVQEERFRNALAATAVRSANPNVLLHVDSSLGLAARGPTPWHLSRPGIALYGWPSDTMLNIEPAFTVRARVIELRELEPGDAVSYGGTWVAPSACRIATLAVGYGDGYRRAVSGRAQAVVAGTRCPVVGTVTMDMIMVDVTDIHCSVGDAATLLGGGIPESISLDEMAAWGGLSPYEVLVGFKLRLPRIYLENSVVTNAARPPMSADGF